MLLSAVSVLFVAHSSSEIPEELMNKPVHYCIIAVFLTQTVLDYLQFKWCSAEERSA